MGLWAPINTTAVYNNSLSGTPSTNSGVTLTSGSGNAKGSWTTLANFASQRESHGFWLSFHNTQDAAGGRIDSFLVDISTAPVGSEQVAFSNLLVSRARNIASTGSGHHYWMPLRVPAGGAISMRAQTDTAAVSGRIICQSSAGWRNCDSFLYTGADAYGVDTTNTTGTTHSPASSGTFSTWTDFPASTTTTRSYTGFMLVCDGEDATSTNNLCYTVEIGYDGTAFARYYVQTSTGEDRVQFPTMPIPCSIPSGVQLQIRATCNGSAETQAFAYYGLY